MKTTRRGFIALPAATLAWAQPRSVPGAPAVRYREYSHCLPDFMRDLAQRAYAMRNREIAKLTGAAAIRERQKWVRETFWKLTGGLPERSPLDARVTGSFERDGYRVEKIVYESLPGLRVPANLYIPLAGKPPYPGVLFQMGHSPIGKAYAAYQRCCQGLARLGFMVLAFDPVGQGERIYYPAGDPTKSRLDSADAEHTVPGRQMLLHGDTMTRMQTWDAVRSLDYLAAHPLVDPKRLASTGQSGGGTLTMMLACVDDRLAAAAVASGNTENFACADFNPPGSTDDAEQNFVGSGPVGFDRWDLLYPLAPKPLLVHVSDRDFFGTYSPNYLSSGHEEFAKLKRVYAALGAADRLEWSATPLPHGLAYDSRLRIYNWFLKWLKPGTSPIAHEPPTKPEEERTLWVSDTGSVVRSFASATPFSLNAARERGKIRVDTAALGRVVELLRVDLPTTKAARFTTLGRVPSGDISIEAVEVQSAPRVWVPAWLFVPAGKAETVRLILEPGGRNSRWREGDLYQELARGGAAVCAPDLRGIGDLRPEFSRGQSWYANEHREEEHWAWASLMLGKPMLGQWVTDILSVVTAVAARVPGRLVVQASGKLIPAAVIAAAVDERVDELRLSGPVPSFEKIARTEDYDHPFANFVPEMLRYADLPEIAAAVRGRIVVGR